MGATTSSPGIGDALIFAISVLLFMLIFAPGLAETHLRWRRMEEGQRAEAVRLLARRYRIQALVVASAVILYALVARILGWE